MIKFKPEKGWWLLYTMLICIIFTNGISSEILDQSSRLEDS